MMSAGPPKRRPYSDSPHEPCEKGQRDDDRHKHRRHLVGESLDRRLGHLRLLHEAHDLGQRGIGADLGGAHEQHPAAAADRTADDGVVPLLPDRLGLSGDHGFVHKGLSGDDGAVRGDSPPS